MVVRFRAIRPSRQDPRRHPQTQSGRGGGLQPGGQDTAAQQQRPRRRLHLRPHDRPQRGPQPAGRVLQLRHGAVRGELPRRLRLRWRDALGGLFQRTDRLQSLRRARFPDRLRSRRSPFPGARLSARAGAVEQRRASLERPTGGGMDASHPPSQRRLHLGRPAHGLRRLLLGEPESDQPAGFRVFEKSVHAAAHDRGVSV
mmetsp:Transcript_26404/g.60832  ORF Transcript_26404/g.60832 Transcript_26404/m.60832 type:complete len:200 (-) Transcript_26404:377-976(-)